MRDVNSWNDKERLAWDVNTALAHRMLARRIECWTIVREWKWQHAQTDGRQGPTEGSMQFVHSPCERGSGWLNHHRLERMSQNELLSLNKCKYLALLAGIDAKGSLTSCLHSLTMVKKIKTCRLLVPPLCLPIKTNRCFFAFRLLHKKYSHNCCVIISYNFEADMPRTTRDLGNFCRRS